MTTAPVHLSRADVSIVLAPSAGGVPAFLYWGTALGAVDPSSVAQIQAPGVPHSALDEPRLRGVVGENVSGFTGLPGLEGFRPGAAATAWAPRLRDWSWSLEEGDDARLTLTRRTPRPAGACVSRSS